MIRDGKNYFRCEDEFISLVLETVQTQKIDNSIDFFFATNISSQHGEINVFIEEKAFKRLLNCNKIIKQMTIQKILKLVYPNATELEYHVKELIFINSDYNSKNRASIEHILVQVAIKLYHLPDNLFESYINEYYLLAL